MTDPQATTGAIISRAEVVTESPNRYAKQLVAHLGRKLEFLTQDGTSTATIGDATGQIVVGNSSLTLIAAGPDEQSVARVEHVLGSHLERFGQRNELTVVWSRSTQQRSEQHHTGAGA
jgi:hypothetical protein